jgi:hypothetical protein
MLEKLLIVGACLGVPILWGVVVNWFFRRKLKNSDDDGDDDEPTIEYYI